MEVLWGRIVGYVLNGQPIVRTTPAKQPSEKELLICEKMTLVSKSLAPMNKVAKLGYKSLGFNLQDYKLPKLNYSKQKVKKLLKLCHL